MAKAKQAPKPKKPRAKQGHLPGMEPPSVPEIEKAADDYVEARDARMAAMEPEASAKKLLTELMKKHGLATYEYDSRIVTLAGEPEVRVKKKKTADDTDSDSKE
jgi:hypothetical protein